MPGCYVGTTTPYDRFPQAYNSSKQFSGRHDIATFLFWGSGLGLLRTAAYVGRTLT